MCGFVGERSGDGPADAVTVDRIAEALVFRGTDGEGMWVAGPVAPAHRR
jgi:asparagine synthase (glutamine-hydrolysing)